MPEKQLREAFALMKQGEKKQAMMIVRAVIRENRQNIEAWWLMSNLLEDEDKILKSLNQVLELNPNHRGARKKLASLRPDLVDNLAPTDDEAKKKIDDAYWNKLDSNVQAQQKQTNPIWKRVATSGIIFLVILGFRLLTSVFNVMDYMPVGEIEGPPPEEVAILQLSAAYNGDRDTAIELTCDSLREEWLEIIVGFENQIKDLGLRNTEVDFTDTETEIVKQGSRFANVRLSGEVIYRSDQQTYSLTYEDIIAMNDINVENAEVRLIVSAGRWVVCSL
jgi:tetratricopeptide (TPR) repeat protein